MNHESPIKRRKSRQIMVGDVPVGGDAPIAVQSMTNTNTCDVDATVGQIRALQEAGADIVRVSVPTMDAAEAFGKIRSMVSVPWWLTSISITELLCGWRNWVLIVFVSTRVISVGMTVSAP